MALRWVGAGGALSGAARVGRREDKHARAAAHCMLSGRYPPSKLLRQAKDGLGDMGALPGWQVPSNEELTKIEAYRAPGERCKV